MTTDTIDKFLDAGRTLADGTKLTNERLEEVFDLVSPINHGSPSWKYPIDCDVPLDAATDEEIIKAVIWFAGGVPEVTQVIERNAGFWHVEGDGYYVWIGA